MKFFDADATRSALPFDRLIAALRERFSGGCEAPPRHVHDIVNPLGEAGQDAAGRRVTSLIMPAWIPGKYYGVKIVNIAPGNARRNLPGLHATYLLFDARTGVPLAQLDGDVITARRTAAASALAGSYLSRGESKHLVIAGAGRVARLLPAAWKAVRPIEHVTVWTRRPEQARELAAQLQGEGFSASATEDLPSACASADIVSCATMANEPVVRGSWLAPGTHLDLIGSFTPAMREADDACFENARVFIDTDEALTKSGDLLVPMQHGVFSANEVRGTLTT
ncbi:MAG: ornithine cyclodeaminase family protein, partial [Hydrogenophaga sp.]|nr:ornithine cyclodeaminase family protein [Hydrogenophaga sp.]